MDYVPHVVAWNLTRRMGKCPVDLKTMKPEEAKAAMERLLAEQAGD